MGDIEDSAKCVSEAERDDVSGELLDPSRCCDEVTAVAETLRTILGSYILGGELDRTTLAETLSLLSLTRSSSAFSAASRSCKVSKMDDSVALLAHGAFRVSCEALASCTPSP